MNISTSSNLSNSGSNKCKEQITLKKVLQFRVAIAETPIHKMQECVSGHITTAKELLLDLQKEMQVGQDGKPNGDPGWLQQKPVPGGVDETKVSSLVVEWVIAMVSHMVKRIRAEKIDQISKDISEKPELKPLREAEIWNVFALALEQSSNTNGIHHRLSQSQGLLLLRGLLYGLKVHSNSEAGRNIVKCLKFILGEAADCHRNFFSSITLEACSDFLLESANSYLQEAFQQESSSPDFNEFMETVLKFYSNQQSQHTNQKKVFKSTCTRLLHALLHLAGQPSAGTRGVTEAALTVLKGAIFLEEHLEGFQSVFPIISQSKKKGHPAEEKKDSDVAPAPPNKKQKVSGEKGASTTKSCYQQQLLTDIASCIDQPDPGGIRYSSLFQGIRLLTMAFIHQVKRFSKKKEQNWNREDLKRKLRSTQIWCHVQFEFWAAVFTLFISFAEKQDRHQEAVKVCREMILMIQETKAYSATEDDSNQTHFKKLRALVDRVLALAEAAGNGEGVDWALDFLKVTFQIDPRLTQTSLSRVIGLVSRHINGPDQDVAMSCFEAIASTYSQLRQLDHFLTAFKQVDAKHIELVTALLQMAQVEQIIGRIFLLSPEGQLTSLWSILQSNLDTFFSQNVEEASQGNVMEVEKPKNGLIGARLLIFLIKNLRVTATNVVLADNLRKSAFQKIIQPNLPEVIERKNVTPESQVASASCFIELYAWLIDLHTRCYFWEEVVQDWEKNDDWAEDFTAEKVTSLLEITEGSATTETNKEIGWAVLQLAIHYLAHIHAKVSHPATAPLHNEALTIQAQKLVDRICSICESSSNCEVNENGWAFFAPHLLVWNQYATTQNLATFLKWVLPACANDVANGKCARDSIAIQLFGDASFYEINCLADLVFPVAFQYLCVGIFRVLHFHDHQNMNKKLESFFHETTGDQSWFLQDIKAFDFIDADADKYLQRLLSILNLLDSVPKQFLFKSLGQVTIGTRHLCALEDFFLDNVGSIYNEKERHLNHNRQKKFHSIAFAKDLALVSKLLRVLVQDISSQLLPVDFRDIEYLFTYRSLQMPFRVLPLLAYVKDTDSMEAVLKQTILMEQKICSLMSGSTKKNIDFWKDKDFSLGSLTDIDKALDLQGTTDNIFTESWIELSLLQGFLHGMAAVEEKHQKKPLQANVLSGILPAYESALRLTWQLGGYPSIWTLKMCSSVWKLHMVKPDIYKGLEKELNIAQNDFWSKWLELTLSVLTKALRGSLGPSKLLAQASLECLSTFCSLQDENMFPLLNALFSHPDVSRRWINNLKFQTNFCTFVIQSSDELQLQRLIDSILEALSPEISVSTGIERNGDYVVSLMYMKLIMATKKGTTLNQATMHALVEIMMRLAKCASGMKGREAPMDHYLLCVDVMQLTLARQRYSGIRSREASLILSSLQPIISRLKTLDKINEVPVAINCLCTVLRCLSFLLQYYSKRLYSCLPTLLSTIRALLEVYIQTIIPLKHLEDHQRHSAVDVDLVPIYFGRLFEQLSSHKDVVKRYVPFILTDYIALTQKNDIKDFELKKSLNKAVFFLLDACTEYEFQQVHTILDATGKSLFSTFYSNYQNHHKYKGNI